MAKAHRKLFQPIGAKKIDWSKCFGKSYKKEFWCCADQFVLRSTVMNKCTYLCNSVNCTSLLYYFPSLIFVSHFFCGFCAHYEKHREKNWWQWLLMPNKSMYRMYIIIYILYMYIHMYEGYIRVSNQIIHTEYCGILRVTYHSVNVAIWHIVKIMLYCRHRNKV